VCLAAGESAEALLSRSDDAMYGDKVLRRATG